MSAAGTRPRRKAERGPRPQLRVVGGRGRNRRLALVPAAMVLVAAVFAVAGLQAYLAQEGFRAAELQRDVERAEEEFSLLRGRVAELSSPARLEESARRLGLTEATDPVFLAAPGPVPDPEARSRLAYDAKRLLGGAP